VFVRVAVLVVCALVVTGCGEAEQWGSDLEQTTSEELCAMVSPAMLEDIFGGDFQDGKPMGIEHVPWCEYAQETDGVPIRIQTKVMRQDSTPDPIADYFGDEYHEPVKELGDRAAFGVNSGADHELVVVTDFDHRDRLVTVLISNIVEDATLGQARPIAEDVLAGLDG